MNHEYFFTNEEINRINLTKFIEKLFCEYRNLYAINIFSYSTSVVKKGKIVGSKPSIKIAVAFKYKDFYCYWFNGGASVHSSKEELFKNIDHFSPMKVLINFSPVNFYLKSQNLKISYEEFQDFLLKRSEFDSEFIRSLVGSRSSVLFCRDNIEDNVKSVLGKSLISKQNAIFLDKLLKPQPTKHVCMKI